MLATYTHRREWGSEIPTHLARDFIYAAVQHPAVAAFVKEYVFDAIATGEDPQSDIAEALRVAIDEILNAGKSEDWERVGRDLIAWARAFLEPASASSAESRWPWSSSLDANGARQRKPPVKVDQEAILAWMHERRRATPEEIAQHFNISAHSAKCKADGLVAQGKITVTPGSRSQRTPRRYRVPAGSPEAASGTADADGRRKLADEQAKRRGLKAAYCEECGFHPENRSQAIAHAAERGSIVATRH